ncbi:MAG: hypothetical protein ABWZ52_09155 [Acidimicrobiales bacterium]
MPPRAELALGCFAPCATMRAMRYEGTTLDEEDEEEAAPVVRPPSRTSAWPRWAGPLFDVAAVVLLTVTATRVRVGSLPREGLWFDDSWVAAGAILGRPGQLLTVGSGHPAFTAILMAVDRAGGGFWALGVPSLVAGIVAPALLYIALRYARYARVVAALLGAALVVAPIHILYSGRVKGYTVDTLLVLILAIAVPWLCRRRWGWRLAVVWTAAAVICAALSGYLLVASASAGVILVLHAKDDRRIRLASVGAQAVIQAAYLAVARSRTDLAGIEEVMESSFDGHITFYANPVDFGRELLKHVRRLAEVYPDGTGAWLTVLALLALGGLLLGAVRGRSVTERVLSRWFALMIGLAFVGALFDQFPFGLSNAAGVSAGGRHALWMIPGLAFGLAVVGQRAWRLVARTQVARMVVGSGVLAVAVVIVARGYEDARPAPFPGSGSADEFALDTLGPDDLLIVTGPSTFDLAISTDTPTHLEDTPTHQVGFSPVYEDPRFLVLGGWTPDQVTGEELQEAVAEVDRVVVLASGPVGAQVVVPVDEQLADAGFTQSTHSFEWSTVDVWTRPSAEDEASEAT